MLYYKLLMKFKGQLVSLPMYNNLVFWRSLQVS